MTTLSLVIVASAAITANDVVLLDFSATYCPPCRQMSPIVTRLEHKGYPIRQIDISENPSLARKYNIDGIPTFVLLVNGREKERIVGATTQDRLVQLMVDARRELEHRQPADRRSPPAKSDSIAMRDSVRDSPPLPETRPAVEKKPSLLDRLRGRLNPSHPGSGDPPTIRANNDDRDHLNAEATAQRNAVTDPMAASIRIRVQDGQETNLGSGTVIASEPGRSMVLTCAHIMDQVSSNATVSVDVFVGGRTQTFGGRIVDHNIDADVGLIEIQSDQVLPTARILPADAKLTEGDRVASIGCGGGQSPSQEQIRVTALNRYIGPATIECSSVPMQGRSGGGLFDSEGCVLGVCSAADRDNDCGLYAGRKPIYAILANNGLGGLVQGLDAAEPARDFTQDAVVDGPGNPDNQPPFEGGQHDPQSLETATTAVVDNANDVQRIMDEIGDAEVTCVIRPLNSRERSRVVIIHRASTKFVSWLEGELSRQPQPTVKAVRNAQSTSQPCREAVFAESNRVGVPATTTAWRETRKPLPMISTAAQKKTRLR